MLQRPRVRLALGALSLVVLAWLPYLGTLSHPLLRDDRTLLDNPWLLREADAGSVFAHDYWYGSRHEQSDLYRPLTVLSLVWNARWKMSATSFRAVNVGLHALCGLIAGWTLLLLFRRAGVERAGLAAWCAAALFVVHPLASEPVLFAVGRADILALALSLWAFALSIGEGGAPRAVASALVFLAALFCKESAACWLLVAAGWVLVERGDPGRRRRALATLVAWSLALGAFLTIRAAAVGWAVNEPPWVDNPLALLDAPARVANALLIFPRYLGKLVWPGTLSVEYGYDQIPTTAPWPWGLAAAIAVLALWAAAAFGLRRLAEPGLWLWTFIPLTFAVTGNVAFPIGVIFAERLGYPALLGACGLAGLLLVRLSQRRAVVVLVVAGLLLLAGARTVRRGDDFRGHRALVEATAEASPRAVKALANYGRALLQAGRPREARSRLERALEIWPRYPRALSLMADTELALGDPARAEDYRRRAREAYREVRAGLTARGPRSP